MYSCFFLLIMIQDIKSGGYLFVTLWAIVLSPFYLAWWYCLFCLYGFTTWIPY